MKKFIILILCMDKVKAFALNSNTERAWEVTTNPIAQNQDAVSLEKIATTSKKKSLTAQTIFRIAEYDFSRLQPNKGWAKKVADTLKDLTDSGIPEGLKSHLKSILVNESL